jgi:hypothetical protein
VENTRGIGCLKLVVFDLLLGSYRDFTRIFYLLPDDLGILGKPCFLIVRSSV